MSDNNTHADTITTDKTKATWSQGDDPQKLVYLEGPAGCQPGVGILAATTKQNGLQTEVVDLRAYVPGVMSSPWAGTRLVTDVPSFLAELDRYPLHDRASTMWGDETRGQVEAIYNDHETGTPGHRDNRLRLELRGDEDWAAWQRLSGKYMPQAEFGDAVEELLHTVVEPKQADLLEVIDSIRASVRGNFESSVTRATGGQHVEFHEDVAAKAGRASHLEVPTTVTLALRPWEGLDHYKVEGYFRLKVQNGSLLLTIKLKPTRAIVRQAWADVVAQIEGHLDGKPVLAHRF